MDKVTVKLEGTLIFVAVFAVLAFVSIGCASGATAPEEAWNRTFGGTSDDEACSVQQTKDGGYIIAGHTCSYGAGGCDACLIKTNAEGYELWNRTFGGSSPEYAYSVEQTADGGYILAGYTESYGAGGWDIWLVKTDSNGNELWNQTFGRSSNDWTAAVQQTTDGGYIIAGWIELDGIDSRDVWLIKTDPDGYELWNRTYGGSDKDYANSVQQTKDGGYIIAGKTMSYGAGYTNVWLIKTDSNGFKEWDRTFGEIDTQYATSVQQTMDGGYIIAGHTTADRAGFSDVWLIKINSTGFKEWDRTFGGTNHDDLAHSVDQTTDGGYIIAGYTESYAVGPRDGWLIKTDPDGYELWNKTFGGTNFDEACSVQQTTDGGYILAGWTDSYGVGNSDFWLIKVKAEELTISISTDKTSYNLGEAVRVTLEIDRSEENPQMMVLEVELKEPCDEPDMLFKSRPFLMPSECHREVTVPIKIDRSIWISGGEYSFIATLRDPSTGEVIIQDTATFEINDDMPWEKSLINKLEKFLRF
jgi:hypothetical protein